MCDGLQKVLEQHQIEQCQSFFKDNKNSTKKRAQKFLQKEFKIKCDNVQHLECLKKKRKKLPGIQKNWLCDQCLDIYDRYKRKLYYSEYKNKNNQKQKINNN